MIFVGLLFAGLFYLGLSADVLVRGASQFARRLGISPFIIGATIIAYGTSLPEFLVSAIASVRGASPIALGNVIGSNLANTSLILGIAVLIAPIAIDKKVLSSLRRVEIPFNLVLTFAAAAMAMGLVFGREKGIVLLAIMVLYLVITTRKALAERSEHLANGEGDLAEDSGSGQAVNILAIIVGLVGLGLSARIMVDSAVVLANLMGVSERFIGLTIVAIGTSLPELAATVAAALKKQTGMVLGNLLGSNLFNIGLVLGSAAVIRPIPLDPTGRLFDFGFLIGNAIALVILLGMKRKIGRKSGLFLVLYYVAFIVLLLKMSF
jgi:cation:H+ antiporter